MKRKHKQRMPASSGFLMSGMRTGHVKLLQPNSITQLLKAVRKGYVEIREANDKEYNRHKKKVTT